MEYIVANWKSHKSLAEAKEWMEEMSKYWRELSEREVVVAPPMPYLEQMSEYKKSLTGMKLACQDLSPFPFGAYTGAVAAAMVNDWCEYAIVGHSERRAYFEEKHQQIANKVEQAREAGIKAIVCVDRGYVKAQAAALGENIGEIIAYEPLEAIGTGLAQDPEEVKKVVAEIRLVAKPKAILYGGSVNADNAREFLKIDGVDGLLVGGASLKAESFARICGLV